MISSLRGMLLSFSGDELTIEVGGVGYQVFVSKRSASKLPAIGNPLFLFIYTAVREDAILLYGFSEEREKKIFQKLILVNGIGPKLAMTILSGIEPSELIQAILQENLVRLTAISGIGKKTAERMVLDLKDRFTELAAETPAEKIQPPKKIVEEVISALLNLGYTRITAEKMIANIPQNQEADSEKLSVETMIRMALRNAEARR